MLYMPIPMQLAGMPFLGKDGQPILDPGSKYGRGFVPPNYGSKINFKDEINPGINLRKTNPLGWQEINKDNIGAAFQGLLNTVTSNPAQFTPNSSTIFAGQPKINAPVGANVTNGLPGNMGVPFGNMGGLPGNMGGFGHSQEAERLLGALTKGSINLQDETGMVSLSPGAINVMSRKGWSAGVNPYGANLNVGPVGIQGTWADDKSIQATFNFGSPKFKMMPRNTENTVLNEIQQAPYPLLNGPYIQGPLNTDRTFRMQSTFVPERTINTYDLTKYEAGKEGTLQEEKTAVPYGGYGLGQPFPNSLMGPPVEVPMSEGRKLMEQQTEDFIRRNPNYRHQYGVRSDSGLSGNEMIR